MARKMGSFRGAESLHNRYESEVNARDPEWLLESARRTVPLVLPIAHQTSSYSSNMLRLRRDTDQLSLRDVRMLYRPLDRVFVHADTGKPSDPGTYPFVDSELQSAPSIGRQGSTAMDGFLLSFTRQDLLNQTMEPLPPTAYCGFMPGEATRV